MNGNPSPQPKILLLGLGSEILSDAGIGPKIATAVFHKIPPGKADLLSSIVGGLDLLQIIHPYQKVLIFDGILDKSSPVGDVRVRYFPDCPDSLHLSNGHDADFSMLKEMAKISGIPFPEEIIFFTVAVKDPFTVSDVFSMELQEKLQEILKDIFFSMKKITI